MATKDDFETIDIPAIQTADISYGYDSQVLYGSQIDASNNRNIAKTQFFAFKINCNGGSIPSIASGSFTDIVFTGLNGDSQKSFNTPVLKTYGSFSGTISKISTIDTPYESNGSIQQEIIIKIPTGRICEIDSSFFTTTQIVKILPTVGSIEFLAGYNTSPLLLSTANPRSTFITGSSTGYLKFKMQWGSTTSFAGDITERPSFSIYIKIY